MVKDINIDQPIPDETIVWRYMDFASFYSLLQTKRLFFRRLDKYTDANEGALPEEVYEFLVEYLSGVKRMFNRAGSGIDEADKFRGRLKELNTGTLSNSWVATPKEVYAMWKIYLRGSTDGIAIRTTVGRLREALIENEVEFILAKVSYDVMPWIKTDYQTLAAYKSKPYSYECELRALVYDQFFEETKGPDVFPKRPIYEHGAAFSVDTAKLIREVYVSPFAGTWFHDIVKLSLQTFLPSLQSKNIISSSIRDL